ncbi:hypothetical protein QR680_004701 [Steinernema hermaphroditum]|uniref:Uncharacterized protein n=1 Tax=Steinernema hermaphroditum TaxID=289476 RepID=A0AA39HRV1_9BILA|nr:hypothetical protein QR680_004701 [Steinernema hermaphroditum]
MLRLGLFLLCFADLSLQQIGSGVGFLPGGGIQIICQGAWLVWSEWSACPPETSSPESRVQIRQRECVKSPAGCVDKDPVSCVGDPYQHKNCPSSQPGPSPIKPIGPAVPCTVVWAHWTEWSHCPAANVPDDKNIRRRERMCSHSPENCVPTASSSDCVGLNIETQTCIRACNIDGEWGEWTAWSACPTEYQHDGIIPQKIRTRKCQMVPLGCRPHSFWNDCRLSEEHSSEVT